MPWIAQTASDGNQYNIYQQDKENSCSCASIAMIARLALNKTLDESTVRGWVAEAEGGFRRDASGVRSFDTMGTYRDVYSGVLQKIGLKGFPTKGHDNVEKWLPSVTRSKPAIVDVNWKMWNPGTGTWDNAGGHAIVCVGKSGSNYVFLDPGIGVVERAVTEGYVYAVTYPGAADVSQGYMERMTTLT